MDICSLSESVEGSRVLSFHYKGHGKLVKWGVTLAQLVCRSEVRASSRVELRCVSCKVQALWAPSGTNHNCQIGNLS